jgi:rhodanese-related sulfurtransferase
MKKGGSGQLVTPFAITILVLCGAVGVALWLAYLPWRWERTKEDLRKRFPDVRRIDADDLKQWLAKRPKEQPVLIDVRPQAEFEFSHVPGARHMPLSETPASMGIPETTNESLVVYDAAGKDSFAVAANLVRRGYARVQALEGGIFEWANRGEQLEGAGGAATQVRAGNSEFAPLLRHRARAD